MRCLACSCAQFLAPKAAEVSIRVVVSALLLNVEAAVVTWVTSDAASIAPVTPIRAHVIIHELALEPLCAHAPIQTKVLGQEGSNILAASIAHPT